LNANDKHIDQLQKSIQDRFSDFEYQIDIDIDTIINESNFAVKPPKPASGLKYWIGGASIITGAVVLFAVLNHDITPSTQVSKPAIQHEEKNVKQDNVPITNATEKLSIPETKTSIATKKNSTPLEEKNTQVLEIPIKEEYENNNVQEISNPELKKPSEDHENFEHFIHKKTKSSKDSLDLFIKKK
jgi:hypothetical protein